jgi:hypothetical protein
MALVLAADREPVVLRLINRRLLQLLLLLTSSLKTLQMWGVIAPSRVLAVEEINSSFGKCRQPTGLQLITAFTRTTTLNLLALLVVDAKFWLSLFLLLLLLLCVDLVRGHWFELVYDLRVLL